MQFSGLTERTVAITARGPATDFHSSGANTNCTVAPHWTKSCLRSLSYSVLRIRLRWSSRVLQRNVRPVSAPWNDRGDAAEYERIFTLPGRRQSHQRGMVQHVSQNCVCSATGRVSGLTLDTQEVGRIQRPRSAVATARPSSAPSNTVNGAARLSQNRALRRAAVGGTFQQHITNVYHMHRRINDQKLPKERRKNKWDSNINPVPAPQLDRTKAMVTSTSPWLPTATLKHAADPMASMRRPLEPHTSSTYHEGTATRGRAFASQRSQNNGTTATWATLDSYETTRASTGTTQGRDHALRRAFREAMLEDVVKGGITDDTGLQRLFDRWVEVNPIQHRAALAMAIKDVQIRLDSPL